MTTDLDRQAILALLVRRERAIHTQKDQLTIKEKADLLIKETQKTITGCNAALKVFDLDVDDTKVFEKIKREYGTSIAQHIYPDDDAPQDGEDATPSAPPAPAPRPTVSDVVLQRLEAAGAQGSKALPLRQYYNETYDMDIHEKTIGMTLYRLLKKGLVRRDGRTWFFVPPESETENPGAATPGSQPDLLG